MSASISWTPVTDGKPLPLFAPQSFMTQVAEALERDKDDLFHGGILTKGDLPALRGLYAGLPDSEKSGRYGQGVGVMDLMKAISKYGQIRLAVEY